MPKEDLKIITFAGVICIACSLLLSATASSLRDLQDQNIENDRKLNVLKAFGVSVIDETTGKKLTGEKINDYFKNYITEKYVDDQGEYVDATAENGHPLYLWKDEAGKRYAIPTSGKGLWSTLYGYIALDGDMSTVKGITFYKHGETPGLGGEVDKDWFQDQFKGKKIYENGELVSIHVSKGAADENDPHSVSGISGATMTGNGINQFLKADLETYAPYFNKVRGS